MSFEALPHDLEQNVQRIANDLHVPRDEALLKIIETGITALRPKTSSKRSTSLSPVVAEALREADLVRAARTEELSNLSTRNEAAASLIGFLKDEPEIVAAIREATRDSRRALYGN